MEGILAIFALSFTSMSIYVPPLTQPYVRTILGIRHPREEYLMSRLSPMEILHQKDPYKWQLPPRWLTVALEDRGMARPENREGVSTYAEAMVRSVWEAVTTGQVKWPDESVMKLKARDWLDAVAFIFNRIEGPPPQDLNLNIVQGAVDDLARLYGMNPDELLAEARRLALPDGNKAGETE